MNVREKTKIYLRDTKLTQSQLAEKIGVNPISLNRYLNYPRSRNIGERLAEFLYEAGYMFGAPPPPDPLFTEDPQKVNGQ